MKRIMIICVACLMGMDAMTQAAFIINRSCESLAYRSLDSAIANAQNGDTLYLPGGTFNVGTITVNKKLILFGAGHYQDSTLATGRTMLNGTIYFIAGSSLSLLQGIYLTGNLFIGSNGTNSNINGLNVSRCNIADFYFSFDAQTPSLATNTLVDENVIRGDLYVMNAKDNLFENNIIDGRINSANGSNSFINNIFFGRAGSNSSSLNNIFSCVFENNIFYTTANYGFLGGGSTANTYRNNVFGFASPLGGADVSENNIFSATNLFVNQTLSVFSYEQNFHLTSGSVAIGAGKGGTDCGVYGGARPYKESAVPMNPHVQFSTIADNTDNAGKINVQVKVAAQQQ